MTEPRPNGQDETYDPDDSDTEPVTSDDGEQK